MSRSPRRDSQVDVGSRVLEVASDLGEPRKELGLRASAEDLQKLVEEVSRLKEAEWMPRAEILIKNSHEI